MRAKRAMIGAAIAAGAAGIARQIVRQRRRIKFNGRTVLITGGSRGLGLALARELADEGARLVLVARSADDLSRAREDIAARTGGDVLVIPADMTQVDEVEWVRDHVLASHGRIDVLINCAGVMQDGPVEHMGVEDYEQALAAHFWAPLHTMNAIVPVMRRQGEGRIVNISSIGGKMAAPHLAPYVASKFALVGLSDTFRAELARVGIHVTTVCPGFMRTGSHVNIAVKGRHRAEFAWFAISSSMPLVTMNVRRAAHQIIEACRYGDARLTVGLVARLAVAADALAPGLVAGIMKTANRLLPRAKDGEGDGDRVRSGWSSQSRLAPSPLTHLADREVENNNELKGHQPGDLGDDDLVAPRSRSDR